MKTVLLPIEKNGVTKEYHLCFTCEALLRLTENHSMSDIQQAIMSDDKEGYMTLLKTLLILSEQGELVRRYYGYAPSEMLSLDDLEGLENMGNILTMRYAAISAMVEGLGKDEDKKEVDVGLAEIRKKQKTKSLISREEILCIGAACHKSDKETLLTCPDVLFKQFDIIKNNKITF